MAKFHRNAIITGYIDSYCLVCESHLRSEEDINGHIAKPIHSKNLDATGFVEKYKDDSVRKVKKGYYCEFCNILLSTAAKVGLHIAEEKHTTNKGMLLLKRLGTYIVFQNAVVINDKAWNGLIEDTCAICNTEFDNESLHKTDTGHILNLVQNKVSFGPDNSIYRLIDDSSFQCLTCNMVLGLNTLSNHFEELQHTKSYQECAEAYNGLNKSTDDQTPPTQQVEKKTTVVPVDIKKTNQVTTEVKKIAPATSEVKKALPVIEENDVKKDAAIKKPDIPTKKQIPPVEVTKKLEASTVSTEAKTDKPRLELVTQDLDDQICKVLGAKEYIAQDENGKRWCLICDWTMEAINIHGHICGRHHQTMLKLHKDRLQNRKKSQQKEIAKTRKPADDVPKAEKIEKDETSIDQENKSKILDSVSKYQKNDININFECNTAVCKKCLKYLDFNCQSIEAHIEEHKKASPKKEAAKPVPATTNQKPEDSKKTQAANQKNKKPQAHKLHEEERSESRASSVASNKENDEEVEKYTKAHNLAYSRSDSKVYCRVCDSRVPASLKNMKEHIAGLHHKNKAAKWHELKQNTKVPETIKIPMKDFIKNIVAVENSVIKDVVINETFCINVFSFMMITRLDRLRCEPCDVNLSIGQVDAHKCSASHLRAMSETLIIVSMESEFIREVRPDIFHCGYCNTVEGGSELDDHLSSGSHRSARTAAAWRLQQVLPDLERITARRQPAEMHAMVNMIANDLFC